MMLRSFSRRKGSADTVMLFSLHSSSLAAASAAASAGPLPAARQQPASRAHSPAKAILEPRAALPAPAGRAGGGGEGRGRGARRLPVRLGTARHGYCSARHGEARFPRPRASPPSSASPIFFRIPGKPGGLRKRCGGGRGAGAAWPGTAAFASCTEDNLQIPSPTPPGEMTDL